MVGQRESSTRRAFLRTAAGGAVVVAAGCTTGQPAPAPAPAPSAPPAPAPALPTGATSVMQGPRYAGSRWFVHVSDRATGAALYELNADQLVLPASTTKLWSTSAALDTFGPDFRFETPVYRRGEVAGDELRGDLILVASGDLTMGGRDLPNGTIAFTGLDHAEANALPGATLTDTDPLAGLDDLARQVAGAGIRRVTGDVLVDARMFDQTPKDDYLLSPIMVNDNLVDLTVTPTAVGAPATVTSRPATAAFQVRATVTTVAAGEPATITVTTPEAGVIAIDGQAPRATRCCAPRRSPTLRRSPARC